MTGIAVKTLGGAGPDIVLLHGLGSDRLSWAGNSAGLFETGRVHALDLPAHGQSSSDIGDGTPPALAERIAESLRGHGVAQAHLIGHSLGGGIALHMAAQEMMPILSLSLIAPVGLGSGVDRAFLAALHQLQDETQTMALLRRLVKRPILINKLTAQRLLTHLNGSGVRAALSTIAARLIEREADLAQDAAAVAARGIRRLTIWGADDAINPLAPSRLSDFGGRAQIVPQTCHLPHIEAADAVTATLRAFLTGADATG